VYPDDEGLQASRGLKRLFERDDRSGIRPDRVGAVQEILAELDDAVTPQELVRIGSKAT
jgi:hypothetical protein